jgi:NAD(P)-dependent dehydrogenase (short-subunit alcohol dehydrogenase family)
MGSKGINVNAIAPGYMATDNTTALRQDPQRSRQILERIPAGRWGEPADIAGAAVFLCSPASDYIHGHILAVDGGWLVDDNHVGTAASVVQSSAARQVFRALNIAILSISQYY